VGLGENAPCPPSLFSPHMTLQRAAWEFWIDRGAPSSLLIGARPDGGLVGAKLLSENPEAYRGLLRAVNYVDLSNLRAAADPRLIGVVKWPTVCHQCSARAQGERTLR